MGLTTIINQVCIQTAVYWGNPVNDGSVITYDTPVEIKCRWIEKNEIITLVLGEQEISHSQVLVLQDLDKQGYLYLGILEDLGNELEDDPKGIDGAYEIKKFDKIPMLRSTTEFLRKAYL